jgi:hypothetical protein
VNRLQTKAEFGSNLRVGLALNLGVDERSELLIGEVLRPEDDYT